MKFTKMHGAGNDFVIVDLRAYPDPTPETCARLSDRHRGIGCDLILGVDKPFTKEAVASYRIWTGDGEPSMQCGNGARCVAAWVIRHGMVTSDNFCLDSPSGQIQIRRLGEEEFRVSLPAPTFDLATAEVDASVEIAAGHRAPCYSVSTGNPHAVIEVENLQNVPIRDIGLKIQRASSFPPSVNVGFAKVVSRSQIQLRVFEFGAGETLACGTGACAAATVFMRQDRVDRSLTVSLPGGDLMITWPDDANEIQLIGPTKFTFEGEVIDALV